MRSRRVQSFVLLVRVPKSVFVSCFIPIAAVQIKCTYQGNNDQLWTRDGNPKNAITSHCYDLLFIVRRSNSSECSFMYLSKAS